MVDKLNEILQIIETDKGSVLFFAITKMDDLTDRWTIILSADWIKGTDEDKEVFKYLINLLINKMPSAINSVARVGIFSPNERLIVDLLKFKSGSHITEDVQANGNIIHEAYIIESKTIGNSAV